jgi:adenylate cyclase
LHPPMADRSGETNETAAQAVIDWLLHDARRATRMREFGDELCRHMMEAGLPIWRAFCGVQTLHPLVRRTAYVWNRESGIDRWILEHERADIPQLRNSPLVAVERSGKPLRRRLEDPDCPMDYPVLEEIRQGGGTDYIVLPMVFSSGEINVVSWTTDRSGGFTDDDIAGLTDITEMLALIVELQTSRRIARQVLDTYVGRRTGWRVLSGEVHQGSREEIDAVIWYCDLRGFTTLTDRLPLDQVIMFLNDYFGIVGEAIAVEGGEILKFIGDAMLAIFELGDKAETAERCAAALRAARVARERVAERNAERRKEDQPEIAFGLALHLGSVSYGNIGAPDRLDFTVIGPAVNHAARLEGLTPGIGRGVVTSASFAEALTESLEDLGAYALRGVREPQRVFAPRDAG